MTREEMLKRLANGEDPLELSIENWEDIDSGKGEDLGSRNCALCQIYLKNTGCTGCPVMDETGKSNCLDTPFRSYVYATTPEERKEASEAEVEFLKSLRKEGK